MKRISAYCTYQSLQINGGSGEIRTHGGRKPSPVFKTGALNHSATLPRKQRRELYPSHLPDCTVFVSCAQSGKKICCRSFKKRCPRGVGLMFW